ncbi:MAG TPA: PAS domain S-box protein, partial [Anaerolineales bacterium]|nr:PAS domain S-box protein [Anaerolineales bacterium]
MNKRPLSSLSGALNWGALQIAGIYLIIGSLWILFSDRLAARIALNAEIFAIISLYKGWGYVLVTALLLYWLIRRHTARLRAGETRLQQVIDALPALISYIDTDRRYQFTNEAYEEWFGERAEGKHMEETLGQTAYQKISKYVDKVLKGETIYYETEIPDQDGGERYVNATYVPDIAANGQVRGFFALVQDMTERKQAQEELRQWADAFDGCAHGIAIGDPNTNRIVVCNPAFASMHKCRVEDIVGSAILSLYAPADHEHVRRNVQKADQIGHASFEAKMIQGDGSTFPVQMDVVSVLGDHGDLLYRVATAQDISERKLIDEKLKESEAKYRTLVESLPAITYISEPGQYIGVSYISPQIESLGFDPNTWLADPEFWLRHIHPDDRERVISELQQFQAGAESFKAEYRLMIPNGETRWFQDESIRVRDQDGKPTLKQGFMLDITDRKRAEEKILLQARLLAQVNDAVIATDENFVLTSWNPAAERIYGWKAEEAIGKKGDEVLQTDFFNRPRTEMISELKQTGAFSAEVSQARRDGSKVQIEARTLAMRDEHGNITGYVSVNRDITGRKQVEEESKSLARFPAENPNPVLRATHEGKIVYANAASWPLLQHWGTKAGDYLPDDWIKLIEELVNTGSRKTIDVQLKDNTYSIIIVPVLEANYVNLYGRDITERKQAEEYLRRFELLAEHSRDIILFMGHKDGRILEANAAAVQAYGYSRDELLALTVQDLRASGTQRLTADQMAQADAGGILFETIHRRQDGTTFPVEVSSQGATIGGVRTLISIVRDITERRQAEEALRLKDQLLHLTSEMAKVGGWEFDPATGKGTWTDEVARIHDLDPSQETNVEMGLSFYAGESREKVEQAVKEAIELAKPYDLELEIVSGTGNHKWVRTVALPILHNGKVVRVQGIFQDITERKQIEKALQEARDELELKVQKRTAALSEANALLQALMDN